MSAHYKSLTRRTNPEQIAIFPLNGTVLLPACDLPLNIFEPRYLNMIDDALKAERLIGMVQKKSKNSDEVVQIGGLGRITQFAEIDADIHNAKQTSEALSESGRSDRSTLTVAMKAFAKTLGVQIDWDSLAEIPLPVLINQAAMISPFLIGLMHLYAGKNSGQSSSQPRQ